MGVHPEGIDAKTMAECVGVSYRQLDHWDRRGVLRPSVRQARGSGHGCRLYSPEDARVGRVLGVLCRLGAEHATLATAAMQLRARVSVWTGHVYVDADGLLHLMMPAGGAWCIDLAWAERHPCCGQATLAGVA
jgi:hypothetical protein